MDSSLPLTEPAWWGGVGIVLTVLAIVVLRLAGPRWVRLERPLMAVFLAGMPVIYLGDAIRHGAPRGWLAVEVGGLVLFLALAVLGLVRSPWFLVAGILGHGLLWDSWHHGSIDYVPDWYVASCLHVDVCAAAWVWVRMRRW